MIIIKLLNYLDKLSFIYGGLLFMISVLFFVFGVNFYGTDYVVYVEWHLIELNRGNIIITFMFDWISFTFISTVFLISSMVIIYSNSYISSDKYISRFLSLVFLFVVSIILLILSPNIIRILLGWDGLGLVSYCLVIYYQNIKTARAGLLTILSNRVGDVAILLRIGWLLNYGRWNFFYLQYIFKDVVLIYVLSMVLLASLTKRAQIPFSAWLPAAMAAPTPVSSLVHSSTLVTAGVYLLIRFGEVLGLNFFLLLISVLTIFMSGVGANLEMDLKKIIALSTLSQLGVIIIILSLGFKELSYFHLITHALFKSLLFLCAGVYIHSFGDIQDIRFLGGVGKILPVTRIYFIGCSLSLCGFPFLAGFYSKDLIIECYLMGVGNDLILFLLVLGTMITVTYSLRLLFYSFMKNLGVSCCVNIFEDSNIFYPIIVLFHTSVFIGSLYIWLFIPCIAVILPYFLRGLVLILIILFTGLTLKLVTQHMLSLPSKIFYPVLLFLGSIWNLPYLSTIQFIPLLHSGGLYLKFLDIGWLEYYGGQGLSFVLIKAYTGLDSWGSIGVKSYLVIVFFFILILVSLIV